MSGVVSAAVRRWPLVLLLTFACRHQPVDTAPAEPIVVQVLAFNDFHGNLRAPDRGWSGKAAGGVDYFAAHIAAMRKTNPNTVVVSAGDLVGASPLVSALFHDEPTIEAMNEIGIDFNGVGNHEFDEGADELLRLAKGGCHPTDGCQDGTPFDGAKFEFLAANVRRNDKTLFAPYAVRTFEGVKVAFIGMTLEGTKRYVPPVIDDVEFDDEAEVTNRIVAKLQKEGVEVFVVIVHEGGFAKGGHDGCEDASGPIVDIAKRMSPAVDVIASGHTHQAYNCVIDGKRVTSAGSFGRLITKIDVTIDPNTRDAVGVEAENRIVTHEVSPVAEIDTLVARYEKLAAPLADEIVGEITAPITKKQNEAGESTLGNLVADAQHAATAAPDKGGAAFAIMNAGGIRTDLATAGDITFGQIFAVQPFGNLLVTITLTGTQIHQVLEQQWRGDRARMLTVSSSLEYAWHANAKNGSRVDFDSIRIAGKPIERDGRYRVTVNDYLAGRGILAKGEDRTTGPADIDAFRDYLTKNRPLAPPKRTRIRRVD